jgi:hypothetical protein
MKSKDSMTSSMSIDQESGGRTDIINEVDNEVNTASRLTQLVKQIIHMIQTGYAEMAGCLK